jgi:hypothetical protein
MIRSPSGRLIPLAALATSHRRVGPIDAMTEFGHRKRRDNDGNVASGIEDFLDRIEGSMLLSLGRDQDARIEH